MITSALPKEMIREVVSYGDDKDKLAFKLTCKTLYIDKNHPKVWEFKVLILDRFTKGLNESSLKNLQEINVNIISLIKSSVDLTLTPSLLIGSGMSGPEAIGAHLSNLEIGKESQLLTTQNPRSISEAITNSMIPCVSTTAAIALSHSMGLSNDATAILFSSVVPHVINRSVKTSLDNANISDEMKSKILNIISGAVVVGLGGTLAVANVMGYDLVKSGLGEMCKNYYGYNVSTSFVGIAVSTGVSLLERNILPAVVESISNKYPEEAKAGAGYASGALKAAGGALEWFYEFGIKRAERALNECVLTPICDGIVALQDARL